MSGVVSKIFFEASYGEVDLLKRTDKFNSSTLEVLDWSNES